MAKAGFRELEASVLARSGLAIRWLLATGGERGVATRETGASCNKGVGGLLMHRCPWCCERLNADPTPRPLDAWPSTDPAMSLAELWRQRTAASMPRRTCRYQQGRPAGWRRGPTGALRRCARAQRPVYGGGLQTHGEPLATATPGSSSIRRRCQASGSARARLSRKGQPDHWEARAPPPLDQPIDGSAAPSGCARPPGAREPRSDQVRAAGDRTWPGCPVQSGPDLERPPHRGKPQVEPVPPSNRETAGDGRPKARKRPGRPGAATGAGGNLSSGRAGGHSQIAKDN